MKALIPAPSNCEVQSVTELEYTKHSTDWNSSSAVPGLWASRRWEASHHYRQPVELVRECIMENHYFTITELLKFPSGQRQLFQDATEECQTSTIQGYKRWSHGMTNVSVPEVNMLKNSSTLAVSIPINHSIKLGFVPVNGPRETYFVATPRRCHFRL